MHRSQYRLTEFYNVDPEIEAIAGDETTREEMLRSFGFERPHMLISAWKDYGYGQGRDMYGQLDSSSLDKQQYVAHSLRNVIELERRLSGSAKVLADEHGTYGFGRYTVDYLAKLAQLDLRNCGKVVLASCAAGDYNGAMWEAVMELESLDEKLPEDTTVIIDEFYDDRELIFQYQRYIELGLKVSHFVLAGHGNPKEIETVMHYGGRGSYRGHIGQQHITGAIGDLIKQLAEPGASVLLDSCSTAKGDDNLARTIFEYTDMPTAGPVADVSLRSLKGKWHNGNLHITPGFYRDYPQGKCVVYKRSPARRYHPGMPAPRNAVTIPLHGPELPPQQVAA